MPCLIKREEDKRVRRIWEWMVMAQEIFGEEETRYDPLTFSIGCHVGPGAFGMGISKKVCI